VLATVVLGVVGLGLVALIERVLLHWHVSQRRSPLDAAAARTPRRWIL
jgi:hypothetical protein